jgi:hypothetical protein
MLPLLFIALLAADADVVRWVESHNGTVETDSGRITAVKLDFAWVTDSDLERLIKLSDLRQLDLSLSLITDAGMERLRSLENVVELNLTSVELITDAAISYIHY